MEKGQVLEFTIEDMSGEGKGIGKADGFAVFVDGAVVGDRVRVQLQKVKKRYGFSRESAVAALTGSCHMPPSLPLRKNR